MNAKKALSSISENQDLWVAQYRQEILERDYNSGMSAAENRGIKKGIAVGEARGEKRGRNAAKLEAARNMILENDSLDKISRCLTLPLETVQRLAKDITGSN